MRSSNDFSADGAMFGNAIIAPCTLLTEGIIMGDWTENIIDQIENKTEKIEALPMWGGSDADTVLCDLMGQVDFECNGIAQDIFDMWKRKDDSGRKAIEQMFYLFTEVTFDNYLMKCDKALSD